MGRGYAPTRAPMASFKSRRMVMWCAALGREREMADRDLQAEFEDWTTQRMAEALRTTSRVLRLGDRRPDLVVLATRKIIELAGASERETERLTSAALSTMPS